jgi:hypothetical protein
MRKKIMRKDEKREVTPEFVNMSKEILYPQIQGVTGKKEKVPGVNYHGSHRLRSYGGHW